MTLALRMLHFLGISVRFDAGAPRDRGTHKLMLAICGALLVLPFLFQVNREENRVTLGSIPCGSACLSHALFGTDCPGCGMSRSFISLAHGRARDALYFHRLGPALYIFIFGLAAYHFWGMRQPIGGPRGRIDRLAHILGWAMTLALIANWLGGVFAASGNGLS